MVGDAVEEALAVMGGGDPGGAGEEAVAGGAEGGVGFGEAAAGVEGFGMRQVDAGLSLFEGANPGEDGDA